MRQQEALAILESGRSALLTGAAGSGKTYVLERFIRRARRSGAHVAVTATTGLAATHLGGTTIHAWSGIGVADTLVRGHARKLSKQRQSGIRRADILVIDEISMLHDFRLDMVDAICRDLREDPSPFGGIQVVLCGDFFQLPPVNRADGRPGGFVTGSSVWRDGDLTILYLAEQHRQRADAAFAELLNALRADRPTSAQMAALRGRIGAGLPLDMPPTRLHTVNVDVDAENDRELARLGGAGKEYTRTSSGSKPYVDQLVRSCLAPAVLRLKVGAAVMFLKNSQERRYANGSLGTVEDFEAGTDHPVVKLARGGRTITVRPDSWELVDGERRRAQLTQVPLRLAWAITVHKSQGMTLDAADIDLRRAFAPGMGYVALSRVGRLDRLVLRGLGRAALEVSDEALAIDAALRAASGAAQVEHATLVEAARERWRREDRDAPAKPRRGPAATDRGPKLAGRHPGALEP